MQDLVIVVPDLYVTQETPERDLPPGVSLPGLEHVARFGTRSRITGGWRSWLSRWLTGSEAGAPATVAALTSEAEQPGAPAGVTQLPIAWMATPVHLVAGMTSVHLDRRSVLRLGPADQSALANDFQRVFHDSGFKLLPLASGDFLMLGPQMSIADTLEPARAMGSNLADTRRPDAVNLPLRRLGGEVEMWLHDHAVNDIRARRGELPVTGLWLWGGGPANNLTPPLQANAPRGGDAPSVDIAFGDDAFLRGLWAARGAKLFALPEQLAEVFGYPRARRAVLAVEIGSMLHSNPTATFFDAVAQIDRGFIQPAVAALNAGQCARLVIVANDHQLSLLARDRFKFWRRSHPGLSGLQ